MSNKRKVQTPPMPPDSFDLAKFKDDMLISGVENLLIDDRSSVLSRSNYINAELIPTETRAKEIIAKVESELLSTLRAGISGLLRECEEYDPETHTYNGAINEVLNLLDNP